MYQQPLYHRLEEMQSRTGLIITHENGQRILHNPANSHFVPPRGCEIFAGRLPRDIYEDTLLPIFERIGPIYKLRLMMDFNGKNRGFCFVTYYRQDVANTAVRVLDGFEVRPGCRIGIFKSLDNTRLFVGGIPVDRKKDEVMTEFKKFVAGIKDVIMYPSSSNQNINRGYVFIEFESHRFAAIARRCLQPGSLVLWDSNIMVDWADPLPEVDPDVMSKVTKLYCRNIAAEMSKDKFEDEIAKIIQMQNVLKVHKKFDYAFIHMASRSVAEEALQQLSDAKIEGRQLEVSWARPEYYSNNHKNLAEPNHFCLSMPAKIRRIIRMRQSLQRKKEHSPQMVPASFIYPSPQMQAFPAPMPHPLTVSPYYMLPDIQLY